MQNNSIINIHAVNADVHNLYILYTFIINNTKFTICYASREHCILYAGQKAKFCFIWAEHFLQLCFLFFCCVLYMACSKLWTGLLLLAASLINARLAKPGSLGGQPCLGKFARWWIEINVQSWECCLITYSA